MKQTIQLKVQQKLSITPQLQQAIRLLQLSSVELQHEIQNALESNIMLEPTEEDSSPLAQTSSEDNAEIAIEDSHWERYDDIGHNSYSKAQRSSTSSYDFDSLGHTADTLQQHLEWQLNLAKIAEHEKFIAMIIIYSLDENGYLQISLEDIRNIVIEEYAQINVNQIEAVLHLIQSMEPAGVACRSLKECLQIQLKRCQRDTPHLEVAQKIIDHHLDLLARQDHKKLQAKLQLNNQDFIDALTFIRQLNPKPCAQINDSRVEYLIPDVYVKKYKNTWQVALNDHILPKLQLNLGYQNLIKTVNREDKTALQSHLQEARWFLQNLQNRNETLLKIAKCIVAHQHSFLEYGEEAMKPLILQDIASDLGMHESTISRATTRKYLHTPRGVFEFKYFFSSQINTDHGQCSSVAIRALIRKLISAESKKKPLSDNKIAALLGEQGIQVARRTVAKYREAMTIAPSSQRKTFIQS